MLQYNSIYRGMIFNCILFLLINQFVIGNPISSDDDMPEGIMEGSRNKRSFYDIHCKGIYDKSIFAKVDQICEDCYNLFREPKLHSFCRQKCFTTEYFKGCVEVLLLTDELDKIEEWIRRLNGLGV